MSDPYSDAIALARGADYLAAYRALFAKFRDDVAALTAGGLTNALVFMSREVSSAVDLALVHGDAKFQAVAMTAASKAVAMPAANDTMVEGFPWVVGNAGAYAFDIEDNAGGTILSALAAGETAIVWRVDDGAAAGTWRAARLSSSAQQARVLNASRLSLFNLAR